MLAIFAAVQGVSDAFNFVVALQLLIVAIGLTKVLEGISWVVEHRTTCRIYWGHTAAAALVAMLQIQYAWTSFYDYKIPVWTFLDFLLACATPVIYLFVSDSMFPDDAPDDSDLNVTYAKQIRVMAALVIAAQIINSIRDLKYHLNEHHEIQRHMVRLATILILCGFFAPFDRFRRVHGVLLWLLVAALAGYCIFLTPAIESR